MDDDQEFRQVAGAAGEGIGAAGPPKGPPEKPDDNADMADIGGGRPRKRNRPAADIQAKTEQMRTAAGRQTQQLSTMLERARQIESMAQQGVMAPQAVYTKYMESLAELVRDVRRLQDEIAEAGDAAGVDLTETSLAIDQALRELSGSLERIAQYLDRAKFVRGIFGVQSFNLTSPNDVQNYYGVWVYQQILALLGGEDAQTTVPAFVNEQVEFSSTMQEVMEALEADAEDDEQRQYYATEAASAENKRSLIAQALALLVVSGSIAADAARQLYPDAAANITQDIARIQEQAQQAQSSGV